MGKGSMTVKKRQKVSRRKKIARVKRHVEAAKQAAREQKGR